MRTDLVTVGRCWWFLLPAFSGKPRLENVHLYSRWVLRMIFAVGALVLRPQSLFDYRAEPVGDSAADGSWRDLDL